MKRFFADLHIHIGRTHTGRPVKITGSKNLTLSNILHTAKNQKGIDIVGIIDCHSPEVLEEIRELLKMGKLEDLKDGGFLYEGETLLLLGSELEIYDLTCQGPIHVLVFMPDLDRMGQFSAWLSTQMKNIHLSSQRIYATGRTLQQKTKDLGGLFIPAHVFTPFKSLFGRGVHRDLSEVFNPEFIDAIELGLSSDTYMADQLKQLHPYTFLSNSDAHSLPKIAREYQAILLEKPSFKELELALKRRKGRKILANYGLDPLLGKYYGTTCAKCQTLITDDEEPCPNCGSTRKTKGVSERILELKDADEFPERPPYIHQVPLEFLPGLGPKTLKKLLEHFKTEMFIIHDAPYEELLKVVPKKTADFILMAREGKLELTIGGGGIYGKVNVHQKYPH